MSYTTREVIDDQIWDEFVKLSNQSTIFATSSFLKCYKNIVKLFIYKGRAVKAAVFFPIFEDNIKQINFLIHYGILFASETDQTVVKTNISQLEISQFIVENILSAYNEVELSFSPDIVDIRAFLWFNYHHNDKKKYKPYVNYTSFIDISDLFFKRSLTETTCFTEIDSKRKKDILLGYDEGLTVNWETNTKILAKHYAQTLLKSGISQSDISDQRSDLIKIVQSLTDSELGFQVTVMRNNVPSYSIFFSIYKNIACYLFGAGDPNIMQRNDAAFCLWNAFKQASAWGANKVDMEGINSPNRGDYKLRFGGDVTPYYSVKLK
jgi:hypothetical protein